MEYVADNLIEADPTSPNYGWYQDFILMCEESEAMTSKDICHIAAIVTAMKEAAHRAANHISSDS